MRGLACQFAAIMPCSSDPSPARAGSIDPVTTAPARPRSRPSPRYVPCLRRPSRALVAVRRMPPQPPLQCHSQVSIPMSLSRLQTARPARSASQTIPSQTVFLPHASVLSKTNGHPRLQTISSSSRTWSHPHYSLLTGSDAFMRTGCLGQTRRSLSQQNTAVLIIKTLQLQRQK